MQENSRRVELGANHRRVVSAVLRRVETTCQEVLNWLERPGSDLHRIEEDVTPAQAQTLRSLAERLREEMCCVQEEIVIDPAVQSRARAIAASVSLARTELEEVLTPGLRGYGALPPETEAALDKTFSRLLFYLHTLEEIAEGGRTRGAA